MRPPTTPDCVWGVIVLRMDETGVLVALNGSVFYFKINKKHRQKDRKRQKERESKKYNDRRQGETDRRKRNE
jgi:hypothetical protein